MKFFAVLVCFVGLPAALWLVDRDPVAGLVVYCALAALVCGLAALAEVRRLRAMEQRARALHHRDVAVVITGGCAAEDCNHEELGDCDTIEFAYCAGCAALAEQVDCYFSERDFRPVAWPCPTIVALDGGE